MLDFSPPPVSFYFAVTFLIGGVVPNPIDIRFQKVSGLSASMTPETLNEGGQNLHVHRLPQRINYTNLILERGLIANTPLSIEFNVAMSLFKFIPSNTLVMMMNQDNVPIANWLFQQTYPVSWSFSDLDANQNSVMIETMELAYTRFQQISI